MSAIPFDTLKLARTLRDKARFTPDQAEGVADALAEAFQDQIATKSDIARLETKIEALELRLTVRLGGMLIVAIGALAALLKLS